MNLKLEDLFHEIPDDRMDCHIMKDGKPVLTFSEEGWKSLGMTLDETKRFMSVVAALLSGVAQKETP